MKIQRKTTYQFASDIISAFQFNARSEHKTCCQKRSSYHSNQREAIFMDTGAGTGCSVCFREVKLDDTQVKRILIKVFLK